MLDVTIDFGGTNIKIGLVQEGQLINKKVIPAQSMQGLIPRLTDVELSIYELLKESDYTIDDAAGIGVALPGIVDSDRKMLLSIKGKYEDATGFSFENWASSTFSLPLIMENDARAAILGEVSYGSAPNTVDAVLVIFGTGIGTAAVMNGKVVKGSHYQAGILGGHFITDLIFRVTNFSKWTFNIKAGS